jgi:hypothetical protein
MQSVHWQAPGPGATDVISVDAQQRHLIMNYGEKGFRSCSEAAPDAFTAFGSSIGGSLLGGGKAEAASAFASTAATIERTQTYNLLRESFFRTCERWLSGAISQDQFVTLAARDHRSMVAVLAIEQMTGVVKAPSTVISGPAVQAMLGRSEELIEMLEKYRAERETFETPETSAKKEYDAVNKLVDIDGEQKRLCEQSTAPAAHAADYAKCAEPKGKYENAKVLADRARARENALLTQLTSLSVGIGASTSAGSTNFGGYDLEKQKISDVKMALISDSVEKIALTAGIDEALMFCAGYLSKDESETSDSTRTTCNAIMVGSAQADLNAKAKLAGFTSTAAASVLSALTPADVAAAKTGLAVIRTKIAAQVLATPKADLLARTAAFESALGLPDELTSLCKTNPEPSDCGRRVLVSTIFSGEGLTKKMDKFNAAIKAWTTD